VNLPEAHSGRWAQGLTAEKMAECRWLKPVLVATFEFVEWTVDGHYQRAAIVGLREGNQVRPVPGEQPREPSAVQLPQNCLYSLSGSSGVMDFQQLPSYQLAFV